jgi:uncharacterized membrane protein YhaH (DUF805 family)
VQPLRFGNGIGRSVRVYTTAAAPSDQVTRSIIPKVLILSSRGYRRGSTSMALLNLWHGRTGRFPYLVALVVSSAAIAVLPFVAGKIIGASIAAGPDPALAILRSLMSPLLLCAGLLITGGPLVFFARRRLRELSLSGVWLLVFPLGPLWMLFLFAVANRSMIIWPLPATSPVMTVPFWVEFAFGAALAVLPRGDYLAGSSNRILRLAHLATTCEGRLGRQTFALYLAIALGSIIVLSVFGPWSMRNFVRTDGQALPILVSAVALANELLSLFVKMFLTSTTIRRLHDLNQRGWWIILFPFGLVSLMALFLFAPLVRNPQVFVATLANPFIMFTSVQGLGCLILLVWLLLKRGNDLDNLYGPPVISPGRRYLPA